MLGVSCLCWTPSPPTVSLGLRQTELSNTLWEVNRTVTHSFAVVICGGRSLCATFVWVLPKRAVDFMEIPTIPGVLTKRVSSEPSSEHACSTGLYLPCTCWALIQSVVCDSCTRFCENEGVTHCLLWTYCSLYVVNCKHWHLPVAFFSILGPGVECRIATAICSICSQNGTTGRPESFHLCCWQRTLPCSFYTLRECQGLVPLPFLSGLRNKLRAWLLPQAFCSLVSSWQLGIPLLSIDFFFFFLQDTKRGRFWVWVFKCFAVLGKGLRFFV